MRMPGRSPAKAKAKAEKAATEKSENTKKQRAIPRPLKAIMRAAYLLAPLWLVLAISKINGQTVSDFAREHTTYGAVLVVPFVAIVVHKYRSYGRVHPSRPKGRARPKPQAPLRSATSIAIETADVVMFLDGILFRVIYLLLGVAAVATPLLHTVPYTLYEQVRDDPQPTLQRIAWSLAGPLVYYAFLRWRVGHIIKVRRRAIEAIWQVAKDFLRYPKRLPATPTADELELMSPERAVKVTDWLSLTTVDRAFILTPSSLSVTEEETWDEFDRNLNARVARDGDWRVRRDPKGKGATIEAANYPTGVLWDGQLEPDPLTYFIGQNLDTSKPATLTLNDVSPHGAGSGGTRTGKTSFAEIVAVQVALKSMPWDENLRGVVDIVDPKGPFARRWRGRRGIVASEGTADHYCEVDPESGEPLTGIEVMALHMQAIDAERIRRDKVLAKYPQAGTWVHLPDEVKRKEKFYPRLVILDEYLDHTESISGSSPRVARENEARTKITELAPMHARKYANVGMFTMMLAQEAKMGRMGSDYMRNLPYRFVTGQMDDTQLRTMFGDRDIPSLRSTRAVNGEEKTVPGRARFMNVGGGVIQRLQIMWFGGEYNDESLDKWLPRGEEPPNGDFTPATGPVPQEPEAEEPGEAPADASASGHDGQPDDEPLPLSLDKEATFPAAGAEVPRCGHPDCENDASGVCGENSEQRCREHLYTAVEGNQPVCSGCYWEHPVAEADLAPILRTMQERADALTEVAVTWAQLDDGRVQIVASRNGGKKLVEVTGSKGTQPTARSRAGEVTGVEPVTDRVNDVFSAASAAETEVARG